MNELVPLIFKLFEVLAYNVLALYLGAYEGAEKCVVLKYEEYHT